MKLTVYITTYNQEDYIAEAIESALNQKCSFDFEILIGEDCSTDCTRDICLSYQKKYPEKVRVICREKNIGLVANNYDLIKHCRGEYLAYLGGDDFWTDMEKLEKQVCFLDRHPDYGLVYTSFSEYRMFREMAEIKLRQMRPRSGWLYHDLIHQDFILPSTICFRRDLLSGVDLDALLKLNFFVEDYPLLLEVSRLTKMHALSDATTMYRVHSRNVSIGSVEKLLRLFAATYVIQNYYSSLYGINFRFRASPKNRKNLESMRAYTRFHDYLGAIKYYEKLCLKEQLYLRVFICFLSAYLCVFMQKQFST